MQPATPNRSGTARSLHEIISGTQAKARRTFQPVRRNSYNAGEREHRHWRPVARKEIGPRLRAAEVYNREHKQPGSRNGPLGHVGLEVLREMYRIVCHRTGRLEPSIDYLMTRLRRSRGAIVAALAALREHGFLKWIRRTEPIDAEGPGPRVRQISNAYWFGLPAKALALVARIIGRAPPPDDDDHRRQTERETVQAMLDGLPLEELGSISSDNPALAKALASLGRQLDTISASSSSDLNPGREA